MGLVIRPAENEDLKEIARQWASSFEPAWGSITIGSLFRHLAPHLWRRAHRALVEELVRECLINVLVLEEEPSVPLAWVAFDPVRLHYVYTLDKARRQGLATRLVTNVREGYTLTEAPTHMTAGGSALLRALEIA
ncbi:MAG: hypothetical protein IPH07_23460 [Deltaproteobacteria bacterium]|nr:hypothetical protein [Deltaproteobacteria bacterium]MBK8241735.1 hypothetical protein [Deltaproteobacteria bacterium]